LRFSPNGQSLGLFRRDTKLGYFEVAEGNELRPVGASVGVPIWKADVSPDGRLLAIATSNGALIRELATGKDVVRFPLAEHTLSVEFHPDGSCLFTSGDSGVSRWPIIYNTTAQASGPVLGQPQKLMELTDTDYACLSPDGETVFVAHPHNSINAFGLKWRHANQPMQFKGHPKATYITVSPDGKWIATGTWWADASGSGVTIWDAQTGALETVLNIHGNANVLFCPNGKWLVTGSASEYRFWEVASWEPRHAVVRKGAGDASGHMAFTSDGTVLALAPSREGVQLVDVYTGNELVTLADSGMTPLCFAPSDDQLLVSDLSGHLQMWDIRAVRQQLAELNLDWE
jgi:WD40 repeat protein